MQNDVEQILRLFDLAAFNCCNSNCTITIVNKLLVKEVLDFVV